MTPVVVVGAGISGLVLAHGLRARGVEVSVLEQAPRAGGVLRSQEVDGIVTEDAANAVLDREPAVQKLLEALGLEDRLVRPSLAARRRYLFTRGKLRPISPPALFFSGLLSLRGRLRLAAEPLSFRAQGPDESLAAFGRRHVGREATEVVLDAVQSGVFAGDIERLSAAAAFPRLVEVEKQHRSLAIGALRGALGDPAGGGMFSFTGGIETLPRALAERLGSRLRTGVEVVGLKPLPAPGEAWQVELAGGEQLEAKHLVLAIPAHRAAALLARLDPRLATTLEEIRYAPLAVVHLAFPQGAMPPPDGFGFLVPSREGRSLLGAIHVSTVFPGHASGGRLLITSMLGGTRTPRILEASDAELVALARAELQALGGLAVWRTEPVQVRVVRWPQAIPQYEVGHLERLGRLEAACAQWPGLFLAGNAYRGPGVADCIRNATLLAERLASAAGGETPVG